MGDQSLEDRAHKAWTAWQDFERFPSNGPDRTEESGRLFEAAEQAYVAWRRTWGA